MGGGKVGREGGREGIVRISTTMMMMKKKMIFCSDFVASYRTMEKKNRNRTRCFGHHHHHFTQLPC